jgi:anti-sigma factor ChrR (cupin superfamily)
VKRHSPDSVDLTAAHALRALEADEVAEAEAHIAACPQCQREWAGLQALVEQFGAWPADVLAPPHDLQSALAQRVARDTGRAAEPPHARWREPAWEKVAPGIECKLLSTDLERQRVSMLVRLAPGASYPAHTHAADEQLHLLDGELWIDGRKLHPGDYNHGEPGKADERVWSETGCTCVLVTSARDALR